MIVILSLCFALVCFTKADHGAIVKKDGSSRAVTFMAIWLLLQRSVCSAWLALSLSFTLWSLTKSELLRHNREGRGVTDSGAMFLSPEKWQLMCTFSLFPTGFSFICRNPSCNNSCQDLKNVHYLVFKLFLMATLVYFCPIMMIYDASEVSFIDYIYSLVCQIDFFSTQKTVGLDHRLYINNGRRFLRGDHCRLTKISNASSIGRIL